MTINVTGIDIETDEEGYLLNPDDWTEDVAEQLAFELAQKDGVKLTDTHWGLITYFRDYYEENKVHPTMHQLVMTLGKQHGKHFHDKKSYEHFLYSLFPHRPVQEICKLAGLPKPVEDTEE